MIITYFCIQHFPLVSEDKIMLAFIDDRNLKIGVYILAIDKVAKTPKICGIYA